mmetsp:Transcript_3047/g.4227  ORF Transcript_3047/g.4227 Transcript_3047/m.4227 type:complete len:306 (-) Transcript_3047:174-1091(-)
MFINETVEVAWMNFFVPTLVSAEVHAVSAAVVASVTSLCGNQKGNNRNVVNMPDYLFVSTNVAKNYPTLMESIIVQTYMTHLPGELAKKWHMGSLHRLSLHHQRANNRRSIGFLHVSAMFAVAFSLIKYLATAPSLLQRMFVRSAQPFFVSGISLVFYVVVNSPVNIAIFTVTFVAVVGLLSYLYLKENYRRNAFAVLPAVGSGDVSSAEDEMKMKSGDLLNNLDGSHVLIDSPSSSKFFEVKEEDEKVDSEGGYSDSVFIDQSSVDVMDVTVSDVDTVANRESLASEGFLCGTSLKESDSEESL